MVTHHTHITREDSDCVTKCCVGGGGGWGSGVRIIGLFNTHSYHFKLLSGAPVQNNV